MQDDDVGYSADDVPPFVCTRHYATQVAAIVFLVLLISDYACML